MNALNSNTDYLASLLDAATPYVVGVIFAQRGDLPDFSLFEKEGEQAAYLEGYQAELAAMNALAALARANRDRQVMTAEEALEHNSDYQDYLMDVDWLRGGL